MKELLRLLPYVKRYKALLVVGLIGAVSTKLLQLAIPYCTGRAIDAIIPGPVDLKLVMFCVAVMAGVRIAEGLTEFLWRRKLISMSHHVAFDIRNTFYRHLLKLSFSWFNQMHTGDIMSRATNDIQEVRGVLEFGVANLLRSIVVVVGGLVLMFVVSVQLTLLALVPLLAMFLIVRFVLPKIYSRSMKVQEQLAAVSADAQENFSGIRVVKTFAVEDVEKKKFDQLSQEYVRHSMGLVNLRALMMPVFMTAAQAGLLIVLWYGGRDVITQKLTIGDLFMFIGYLRMMMWPMASFGFMIARFQRGAAAMARINRILELEPEIRDDRRTGEDLEIRGEIEFRNLSFQYPESSFAVRDLNLRIPAGATVGIVGPIGSGKSSFISLIMRLFDVPDGTLFIDGRDINTVPIQTLRSSIGCVPQGSFLFSETIRENISFGKPGVELDQVIEAARVARVDDDIEQFTDKYEQLVGERGVTLSGGQKQRVAIARALVLNPKILILDDSLSSVDTHTEEEILQGLRSFSAKRTTLIISHRISTVAAADFIIVFDDGEIVEQGTHNELVAKDGLYGSIHRKQQLEAAIDSEGDS